MENPKSIPVEVSHLFKTLDEKLISLLESLSDQDWTKQTVAIKWKVKDVASHLLDGNLRTLSMQRDGYFGEKPVGVHDYQELVNWLNRLNSDWVQATHRISPSVLIALHKATGPDVSAYYASLDPWQPAVFAVDWVGDKTSYNWMHLAREYSEKWHHQQQIRDATDKPGIMTREFFYPAIATFMLALPHTFRRVEADPGTNIQVEVTGEAGGCWFLSRKENQWQLSTEPIENPDAKVKIPPEISWKLFSKSLRANEVMSHIEISGNRELALQVLEMVSVMA